MATTRTANQASDRLGPYVCAFAAGAIALSSLLQARKADHEMSDDAKARDEIGKKLLDRFARQYSLAR